MQLRTGLLPTDFLPVVTGRPARLSSIVPWRFFVVTNVPFVYLRRGLPSISHGCDPSVGTCSISILPPTIFSVICAAFMDAQMTEEHLHEKLFRCAEELVFVDSSRTAMHTAEHTFLRRTCRNARTH